MSTAHVPHMQFTAETMTSSRSRGATALRGERFTLAEAANKLELAGLAGFSADDFDGGLASTPVFAALATL